MKKSLVYIVVAAMTAVAAPAAAQTVIDGVYVKDLKMEQGGDYLKVNMILDMKGLDVASNKAVVITPVLVKGADSLRLPAVGVYGRTRYYHYQRTNGTDMISGNGERSFKSSQCPDTVMYSRLVPYRRWMDGANLELKAEEYGCCRHLLASETANAGRFTGRWFPELVYVIPQARAEKNFSVKGSAFIDFPVNQTVIAPDYRSNTAELGKIKATIDDMRGDGDVKITEVWLKGYASPEGPYDLNASLAKGRTEALRDYIERVLQNSQTKGL